jgi:hypothetical protein
MAPGFYPVEGMSSEILFHEGVVFFRSVQWDVCLYRAGETSPMNPAGSFSLQEVLGESQGEG